MRDFFLLCHCILKTGFPHCQFTLISAAPLWLHAVIKAKFPKKPIHEKAINRLPSYEWESPYMDQNSNLTGHMLALFHNHKQPHQNYLFLCLILYSNRPPSQTQGESDNITFMLDIALLFLFQQIRSFSHFFHCSCSICWVGVGNVWIDPNPNSTVYFALTNKADASMSARLLPLSVPTFIFSCTRKLFKGALSCKLSPLGFHLSVSIRKNFAGRIY